MVEQLVGQIETRFADLERDMADPDVIADRSRYAEVGRAYRELQPARELAREYRKLNDDLEGARELLEEDGDDPELKRVLALLRELPEEQREAILLVSVEGFSYQEAADIAGAPIGTIMSRLSRGRARLRELTAPPVEARLRSVK